MKKLNVAIIGQGRSGKGIHGVFLKKEENVWFDVKLYVFQQSFYAPFYRFLLDVIETKKIGDVVAIDIKYNKLGRRWDWQTLQCMLGGNAYNTGPHPFGFALGFLGFAEDAHVAWSLMKNTPLFAGESDNFCRAILTAAGKPCVEVEISDLDEYTDYTVKLQGSFGTLKCTPDAYTLKYVPLADNAERAPLMTYLEDGDDQPAYCKEQLTTVTEEGSFDGTAFDIGTRELYKNIYENITEGKEMYVTAKMASRIVGVIEAIHAQNPLAVRY